MTSGMTSPFVGPRKPTLEFREMQKFSLDLDAGSLQHEEVMVINNQCANEDLSAATLSDIPPVVLDQSADIDPPEANSSEVIQSPDW